MYPEIDIAVGICHVCKQIGQIPKYLLLLTL